MRFSIDIDTPDVDVRKLTAKTETLIFSTHYDNLATASARLFGSASAWMYINQDAIVLGVQMDYSGMVEDDTVDLKLTVERDN